MSHVGDRSAAFVHSGVTRHVTPGDAIGQSTPILARKNSAYRQSAGTYFAGAVPAAPSAKLLPAARQRHWMMPSGMVPAVSAIGAASVPVYGMKSRVPPPARVLRSTVTVPVVES